MLYLIKEKSPFEDPEKNEFKSDSIIFKESLWELASLKKYLYFRLILSSHYTKEVKHLINFFEEIEDVDLIFIILTKD